MAGNTPNVSRDSFAFSKMYDSVRLQQGVPVLDSDWNEQGDVVQISQMLLSMYGILDGKFPPTMDADEGYRVTEATSPSQNFQINAGWALVKGVLVPTVLAEPPTNHDYEDDTNRIGEGTVSSVGTPNIIDEDKYWEAFHNLVGCRVKMTSGAESGNTFTIASLVGPTTLELSGGIGGILAGDTYIVKPPALTTPGGSRTDKVYVMVWFEDINENEDTNIVNPGVAVETAHRRQRRWCVRVAENASTPTTPVMHGFGARYFELATLSRTATANVEEAMITNRPFTAALGKFSETDGSTYVKSSGATDHPTSLAAGTVKSQLLELLVAINTLYVHPSANPTTPQLVWRSHSIESDAAVTGDTVSIYVSNKGWFLVTGAYLNSSYEAVTAPVSPENVAVLWAPTDEGSSQRGFKFLTKRDASGNLDITNSFYWDGYIGMDPLSFSIYKCPVTFNGVDVNVSNNGTLNIANTGDLNFQSGSDVTAESGSTVTFNSGSTVSFQGTGEILETAITLAGATGDTNTAGRFEGIDLAAYYRQLFKQTGPYTPNITYGRYGIWIAYNAQWDNDVIKWMPEDLTRDAVAFRVGAHIGTPGIYMLSKSHDDGDFSSGWSESAWTRTMRWGQAASDKEANSTYTYNCFYTEGDLYERCKFSVGATADSTGGFEIRDGNAINFRNRYSTTPSNIDVVTPLHSELNLGGDGLGGPAIYPNNSDNWGICVQGMSIAGIAAEAHFWGRGYIEVFT